MSYTVILTYSCESLSSSSSLVVYLVCQSDSTKDGNFDLYECREFQVIMTTHVLSLSWDYAMP